MDRKIIEFEEIPSTNTYLKELALENAPFGTVVTAKKQTSGRGRMGKSFISIEQGLYLSLLVPMKSPDDAGLITTFAAVAVARALEKSAPLKLGIKWVNDVYSGGRKLCGILAEGGFRGSEGFSVIGIGINLYGELPSELSEIATTAHDECGVKIDAGELLRNILAEFGDVENLDFSKNLDEYRHRSIILGKIIDIIPHSSPKFTAKAIEIDDNGRLVVERDGKTEKILSGEVSIRTCDYNFTESDKR